MGQRIEPARGSRRRGLVVHEEAFSGLVQLGKLFLDDRPDHIEVDSKVLVCDQVAESDDLRPRDLWSKGASVVGDLCRGLAYDDKVVENCMGIVYLTQGRLLSCSLYL